MKRNQELRMGRAIYMLLACTLYLGALKNANGQEVQVCAFPDSVVGQGMPRYELSGTVDTIGTQHFVIWYTLSGLDSTTSEWADSVAKYAEECWSFVSNTGWHISLQAAGGGLPRDQTADPHEVTGVQLS